MGIWESKYSTVPESPFYRLLCARLDEHVLPTYASPVSEPRPVICGKIGIRQNTNCGCDGSVGVFFGPYQALSRFERRRGGAWWGRRGTKNNTALVGMRWVLTP